MWYSEARSSLEVANDVLRSWDEAGPLPGTWLVVAVVVEMWGAAAGVVSDDGGGDGGDA